ncbi:MAG TPA: response regulator transcription factor [Terriglobales bacterium]|nr:response regulator transcription factor [Terriglobales bacterium]
MDDKNRARVGKPWFVGRGADSLGALAELDDPAEPLPGMMDNREESVVLEGGRPALSERRTFTVAPVHPPAPTVVPPFQWKELVARVCEFVRDLNVGARLFWLEDVCVDLANREARRSSGEAIALTNQEFKTLKCFLDNPQRALSREELLNQAWGYENYPTTRTVDNHVLKLRQKFERNPARPVHFLTVHGFGYKFVP